ncbi:hypothetical protein A9R01_09745 ['Osedax' symbiont bacterium Rs2_46_30_T18]|nr:hypothetical protein A9R01_09745 ['Osedax' symbiont bacterium Rs2_46_30_T18]
MDIDISRPLSGEVIKPIVQNGFNHHSLSWQDQPVDLDLEQEQEIEQEQEQDIAEQPEAQTETQPLSQDNAEDTAIDDEFTATKGSNADTKLSD